MSDKIEDYQVLNTKTSHLGVPELITTFLSTGTALQDHSFFGHEDNWPSWLEGPKDYFGYADSLRVLDDEYHAGNRPKKTERDLLRDRAAFNYEMGGDYVIMRAYDLRKPELLLNTYPLMVVTRTPAAGLSPNEKEITLTGKSGAHATAILRGHHMLKGGPYQVGMCKGNPLSDESWIILPEHYLSCAKIVITNLDPVSMYYFRIRYNGPLGPGPWSQVVNVVIT